MDAYHVANGTKYNVTGVYCMFCGVWLTGDKIDRFWLDFSQLVVCENDTACRKRLQQHKMEEQK